MASYFLHFPFAVLPYPCFRRCTVCQLSDTCHPVEHRQFQDSDVLWFALQRYSLLQHELQELKATRTTSAAGSAAPTEDAAAPTEEGQAT